jgi:hypothetical protein
MISPTLLDVQRNGTTLHLRVDDLTLEEEALTTDTITVWSLYDCHDMERIYAILTDALGKPVYIDIYSEETATTVSVWIIELSIGVVRHVWPYASGQGAVSRLHSQRPKCYVLCGGSCGCLNTASHHTVAVCRLVNLRARYGSSGAILQRYHVTGYNTSIDRFALDAVQVSARK